MKLGVILAILAFIAMIGGTVVVAIFTLIFEIGKHYRVLKINDYQEEVTLYREYEEIEVVKGMNLSSGDQIYTFAQSQAEIVADSDKYILIRENSGVTINSTGNKRKGKLEIVLDYGSTLIEIENKLGRNSEFEVHTPNAIAAVRGTIFEVRYDANNMETTIIVTEGTVEVTTNNGTQMIGAGEACVAQGRDGDIISIIPVPKHLEENAFDIPDDSGLLPYTVSVKELEGWGFLDETGNEYVKGSLGFVKDDLFMVYSLCGEDEYNQEVAMWENDINTEEPEYVKNTDGDTVTVIHYYEESGSLKAIEFLREIEAGTYLRVYIYDYAGGEILGGIQVDEFVKITTKEYFVGAGEVSNITEEELLSSLRGNADREFLVYCIAFMTKCNLFGNTNYLATALGDLYYDTRTDSYDIAELNEKFSLITDETIQESMIPSTASIQGDRLVYEPCNVTEGDYISVTIEHYTRTDSGEIQIDYSYKMSYGSDGTSGCTGTAVAHLVEDANGEYMISYVEILEREEWEY